MTTRTKLVCTLGPATNTPKFIRGLVAAGASIFRINFSHGSPDDHARAVELVRAARRRATGRSP
jgi:pyruvate kinase